MENRELLKLLYTEPNKGIGEAMSEYTPILKAIVSRILPCRQSDIEECIADAYVALWKNIPYIVEKKIPVKAWLIVTARNAAINRYRKLIRTESIPLNEDLLEGNLLYLEDKNWREDVYRMLADMNETSREIFIRRYYFLETSSEIANKLKITEDNVNQRLSRGRKELKAKLIKEGAF